MKTLRYFLPFFLLSATCIAQIPTSGLVAYYPFTGNANDESGNGNNGTVTGATLTMDRFGVAGKAYDFNGISDFIDCGYTTNINSLFTNQISVSAWVMLDDQSGGGFVVGKWGLGGSPSVSFHMGIYQPSNIFGLNMNNTGLTEIWKSFAFAPSRWYHLVATGSPSGFHLYVNGSLVESNASSLTYINIGTHTLRIGYEDSGPSHFKGKIDDVRIYNRALTGNEIQTLYHETACPVPATGLVAYYPFNANANDESGNGWNGTLHNVTPATDRFGMPGKAYAFNGNSWIDVQALSTLPLGSSPRTVSAWFKSSVMINQVIVEWGYHAQGQRSCLMLSDLLGGVADFSGYINDFRGTTHVIDNAWHNFTFTFDGTTGTIFVDGVLDASMAVSLNTIGTLLSIGRRGSGNQSLEYFRGDIDDIRIYDRVLSPCEVQSLFHESMSPCSTNPVQALVANSPILCNGGSSDVIVTASGGTPPYSGTGFFSKPAGSYDFIVTDAKGCTATAQITLTEPPLLECSLTVTPSITVAEHDPHTIYLGYGAQSVTLTATGSGGTLPYTYSWNAGLGAGATKSVSPQATTNYVCSITDANQCTNTCEVTINVVDVRCGNNGDKIMLCHNGNTLCISPSAVPAHLTQHGDKLGTCLIPKQNAVFVPTEMELGQNYPNPFNPSTIIEYSLPADAPVHLAIYDLYGRLIAVLVNGEKKAGRYAVEFDATEIPSGSYLYKLGVEGVSITRMMTVQK